MSLFTVTVSIEGVGLDAASQALEQAGIKAGSGKPLRPGEAPSITGPRVVAEVEADTAGDAEDRVSNALPHGDYKVTVEPQ